MKITIREIMKKLSDIKLAIDAVETHMANPKTAYTCESPKDQVIDLLTEYADMIEDTKVEI